MHAKTTPSFAQTDSGSPIGDFIPPQVNSLPFINDGATIITPQNKTAKKNVKPTGKEGKPENTPVEPQNSKKDTPQKEVNDDLEEISLQPNPTEKKSDTPSEESGKDETLSSSFAQEPGESSSDESSDYSNGSTSDETSRERKSYSDVSTESLASDDSGYYECPRCGKSFYEDYSCPSCSDSDSGNIFVPSRRNRDKQILSQEPDPEDLYAELAFNEALSREKQRKKQTRENNTRVVTTYQGFHSLTICTFNTWRLGKGTGSRERDVDTIVKTLDKATVIVLQEVENYDGAEFQEFVSLLSNNKLVVRSVMKTAKTEKSRQRDHFVIIFNGERLDHVIDRYIEEIVIQNDKYNYVPYQFVLSLNRESANLIFNILSVHFSTNQKDREKEISEIATYISQQEDKSEAWIIIGDFNTENLTEINKLLETLTSKISTHQIQNANINGKSTNSYKAKIPKPYDGAYVCIPKVWDHSVSILNFEVEHFDPHSTLTTQEYKSTYSDHAPCFFKLRIRTESSFDTSPEYDADNDDESEDENDNSGVCPFCRGYFGNGFDLHIENCTQRGEIDESGDAEEDGTCPCCGGFFGDELGSHEQNCSEY